MKRAMKIRHGLSLYLGVLLISAAGFGGIIHVPGDYAAIQAALDTATDGDTIIVGQGTYYENINFLGKAVTLRSMDPNDPAVVAGTVIDGSRPADPNIGSVVTFNYGEGNDSIIEGFTLNGGTGQTDPTIDWRIWTGDNGEGGGIICVNSSPTISKNIIKNCRAEYGGGGIFCHNHASPIIANNTIESNYAGWYGGGIFCRYYCSPTIYNNQLIANDVNHLGGAIYLAEWSDALIYNNYIFDNKSIGLNGGAVYYFVWCDPIIANNIFLKNSASKTGSAIMVSSDSGGSIVNNLLYENMISNPDSFSASLSIYDAYPTIANNIILNNQSGGVFYDQFAAIVFYSNNVWENDGADYKGFISNQTGNNGNISQEPMIGNALPKPFTIYELHPESPCIDAGSEIYFPSWLHTDFDGTPRKNTSAIDMGPQEYRFICVPNDYPTIQAAIDDSQTGDEIVVLPGTYNENLNFKGKNLILRAIDPLSEDTVKATIINGGNAASCITLNSGENNSAVVAGFNIQNGNGEFGGGIYVADNCGVTAVYNYIHHNYARRYGGGIDSRHYSNSIVKNNIFEGNHANSAGGGLHIGAHAVCDVRNNIFKNNTARYQGGGFYSYNYAKFQIVENIFYGNHTLSGGAIYVWAADGIIDRNHIYDNFADNLGGGIAIHPTYTPPHTHIMVSNNIIEGNTALNTGGGIYLLQGETFVINNTLAGNESSLTGGAGIALESGAFAEIINNIISESQNGYGIHLKMPYNPDDLKYPLISYNCLWQNGAGNYGGLLEDHTGLSGNISADPEFILNGYFADNNTPSDPNDDFWIPGDYHYTIHSPCYNAGKNQVNLIYDYLRRPRFVHGNIDLGAHELQNYNLASSCKIDIFDLVFFMENWLLSGDHYMDLNNDQAVDYSDFSFIFNDWLE